MAKYLKVSFPERCIGCELCVMEVGRQLGRAGLNGSLIRVLRKPGEKSALQFFLDVDPKVNELDIKEIERSCPKAVFTIEERTEDYGFND